MRWLPSNINARSEMLTLTKVEGGDSKGSRQGEEKEQRHDARALHAKSNTGCVLTAG